MSLIHRSRSGPYTFLSSFMAAQSLARLVDPGGDVWLVFCEALGKPEPNLVLGALHSVRSVDDVPVSTLRVYYESCIATLKTSNLSITLSECDEMAFTALYRSVRHRNVKGH